MALPLTIFIDSVVPLMNVWGSRLLWICFTAIGLQWCLCLPSWVTCHKKLVFIHTCFQNIFVFSGICIIYLKLLLEMLDSSLCLKFSLKSFWPRKVNSHIFVLESKSLAVTLCDIFAHLNIYTVNCTSCNR